MPLRRAERQTLALIALTALAALLCGTAVLYGTRLLAQEAQAQQQEPVEKTDTAEPQAQEKPAEPLSQGADAESDPSMRDSADNNVSFPIDI
ncbi:MAG: hypothetical protein R3E77_15430 [Steroidobacteraceae bacterium]